MRVSGLLFLAQQTLGSLALLIALGRRLRLRRCWWRLLLASALGGTLCALGVAGGRWEGRIMAWLMTAMVPAAAFPHLPKGLRRGAGATTLLAALVSVGLCRLAVGLGAPLGLASLAPLALPGLMLLTGRAPWTECSQIVIRRDGHKITLTAMVDSGNLLRDPITGLPVIVCSRKALVPLLPPPSPEGLAPGMRLISVRTVAGTALMAVFRPQETLVRCGGTWRKVTALVGIAPQGYNGCQALIPACVAETAAAAEAVMQGG